MLCSEIGRRGISAAGTGMRSTPQAGRLLGASFDFSVPTTLAGLGQDEDVEGMSATTQHSKIGLVRTADEMAVVREILGPFHRAGYRLILLSSAAKVPIEKGWQTKDYTTAEIGRWLKRGGNVGILLRDTDLVVDIDTRHGGIESLMRLQDDLGIDLSQAPVVFSGRGDGGKHIYMQKPAEQRVRKAVPSYPGIDIKTAGGFVLAPGSRHPDTGGLYRPDPAGPGIEEIAEAPAALLRALQRPNLKPRRYAGGGELTPEDLALALNVLDPAEYGKDQYPRWLRLAAACHDATNGEGLEVWLEWAARDEDYGAESDAERNVVTWESFTAGKPGGANYLTLLWEVARAGRPDISRRLEPGLRFELQEPLESSHRSLTFEEDS